MDKRRVFSEDQKQEMLKYLAENGVTAAAQHYNVTESLLYRWRKRGADGATTAKRKYTPRQTKPYDVIAAPVVTTSRRVVAFIGDETSVANLVRTFLGESAQ